MGRLLLNPYVMIRCSSTSSALCHCAQGILNVLIIYQISYQDSALEMLVEEGIRPLARILGLSSKRAFYDEEAELLICAEALNRIRFLEEEVRKRLQLRNGTGEDAERGWREISSRIARQIAEEIKTVVVEEPNVQTGLSSSSDLVDPAAIASAPVALAPVTSPDDRDQRRQRQAPGDEPESPRVEIVKPTMHLGCVLVTPKRLVDLDSPVAMHDPVRASPRVLPSPRAFGHTRDPSPRELRDPVRASPRVLPSPQAFRHSHASPGGPLSPRVHIDPVRVLPTPRAFHDRTHASPNALSPPVRDSSHALPRSLDSPRRGRAVGALTEPRRMIKGRASRRLSFDGGSEGECARASGSVNAVRLEDVDLRFFFLQHIYFKS